MDRQRKVALIALAALALIGMALAVYAFAGSGSSPQAPATTPGSAGPTFISPGTSTGSSYAPAKPSNAVDGGSFFLVLPKAASDTQRAGSGDRDQVTFSVGAISGEAATQSTRPGESLGEMASLYGSLRGHRTVRMAGKPAYLYASVSAGRFSIVAIGLRDSRLYTLHLVGPKSDYARALALAKKTAASMQPVK